VDEGWGDCVANGGTLAGITTSTRDQNKGGGGRGSTGGGSRWSGGNGSFQKMGLTRIN